MSFRHDDIRHRVSFSTDDFKPQHGLRIFMPEGAPKSMLVMHDKNLLLSCLHLAFLTTCGVKGP